MPHKLLLADDSVTIQRVIELTFAEEDVRVIAVGDGKQAIERIQSERPDIVLADVGMPERDGYEVAAFVKGNPDLAHVPVLLLTGAFEPVDEPRARAAGCDGVLVKPFEPQMVINRVKDLLAGKKPAGLWAAAPAAQPTRQPAPLDLDIQAATPASKQPENLDDYFDRLDAVFADLDSTPAASAAPQIVQPAPAPAQTPAPAPPPRPQPIVETRQEHQDLPGDVLADWDPDLTGDPTRPSPIRDTPVVAAPPPAAAPPPTPPAAPRVPLAVAPPPPAAPVATSAERIAPPQGPSLAEAFAALLAAEQGQAIAPAAARPVDIPQDTIDSIVARVLERVTSDAVRKTVVDVAERMVRDEIARIKRGG